MSGVVDPIRIGISWYDMHVCTLLLYCSFKLLTHDIVPNLLVDEDSITFRAACEAEFGP